MCRLLDPVFKSVPEFSRLRDYLHRKENEEKGKRETPVDHLPSEEESEVVEEEGMESEGVMATRIGLLEMDSKDEVQVGGFCSVVGERDHTDILILLLMLFDM